MLQPALRNAGAVIHAVTRASSRTPNTYREISYDEPKTFALTITAGAEALPVRGTKIGIDGIGRNRPLHCREWL
jgi:hypothetical protein